MKKELFFILLLFIILIYILNNIDYDLPIKPPQDNVIINDQEEDPEDKLILIKYKNKINNYSNYVTINHAKGLTISNEINEMSKFRLIPCKKNKLCIQSNVSEMFINILYTTFYNNEYDVLITGNNCENNTCKLKIYKYKKYFYIKFYNGYYLSIKITGGNGILYASKDKKNIFYFKIIKLTQ